MQLENRIIEKIERENIRPVPRWRFVAENRLEWLLEIALFGLGSLVTVLIWNSFGRNLDRLTLGSVPYFLLAVLVLIMLIMRRYSFKLDWGYGLAPLVFLGLFLVGNAALGTIMHFNQIPEAAEVKLKRLPPTVHKFILPEIEELEEEIEEHLDSPKSSEIESDESEVGAEDESDENGGDESREDDELDEEDEAMIRHRDKLSGSLMRSDGDDEKKESDRSGSRSYADGSDDDADDHDQQTDEKDAEDEEIDSRDEADDSTDQGRYGRSI